MTLAAPEVTIVGECRRTSAEAEQVISREAPDILLLDIEMPEGDGFSVLQRMPPHSGPLPIFVTAYSAHAVRAFDAQAFDYLLKPISAERLRASLDRARQALAERRGLERPSELPPLGQDAVPDAYAERLAVPAGPRIRVVPVNEVEFITAQANYVELHIGSATHLVRETMAALEPRLDPRLFVRVHRSRIVRLDLIADIEPLGPGAQPMI